MNIIKKVSIFAQLIGVLIFIANLMIEIPKPLYVMAVLLIALPVVTMLDKVRREWYILLLCGVAVLITSLVAKLHILWFIGGLVLMAQSGLMLTQLTLSEMKSRSKGEQG